jgi:Tfp pilus assembly protein PilX
MPSRDLSKTYKMKAREDHGFAMIMTVMVLMVVIVLLSLIFAQGMQTLPLARQAQDYQAALQAADSGIEDYINRLDNNTTYYTLGNTDASNPALENGSQWTTWAPVPGTTVNEWFRYAVNNTSTARTGVVALTVTGAAGQNPAVSGNHYATRTVKETIRISGFTSFLYYTDYEIESPTISGLPSSCVLHAWEANTAGGYGPDPYNCGSELIYFVGRSGIQDGLHGAVFSNDELHICGNPAFPAGATTAYNQATNLGVSGHSSFGGPGAYYGNSGCTNAPTFGTPPGCQAPCTQPAGAPDSPFPATNTTLTTDIAASNNGGGCAYKGPITVTLNPVGGVGKMTVTLGFGSSVDSSLTPSGQVCTGSNISLPPNGLLYDENGSSSANVTVSGTLAGQLTIGSQTNITVAGNIAYNSGLTGSDMLGLSATNDIVISPPTNNLTIDAAMVALNDSIYVKNWASIPVEGTLNINGSMAQKYRGAVGTFTSNGGQAQIASGYDKNYVYDSRLRFQQPPYFTSPTLPNWVKSGFAECNQTATPSMATC